MNRQPQAEIFIKTLAEMRDEERACQMAELRLQNKADAERFAQGFWTRFDDSRPPSEWTLQAKHTAQFGVK